MKILGKTPDGDLIIQVSQDEWDDLGDGVRPKDNVGILYKRWHETEAYKVLGKRFPTLMWRAFRFNQIDGSLQSLRDLADGKPSLGYVNKAIRTKLKKLLDEQPNA